MADIGIDVFHLSMENHKVVLLFLYQLCIVLETSNDVPLVMQDICAINHLSLQGDEQMQLLLLRIGLICGFWT